MNWYIVQAYSGFEKKVVENIKEELKKNKLSENLDEILVPTHQVTEVKKGKRTKKEKKFFPGYVLIKIELTKQIYHLIKNLQKVSGFLGSADKPTPISDNEIKRILGQVSESAVTQKVGVNFEATIVSESWRSVWIARKKQCMEQLSRSDNFHSNFHTEFHTYFHSRFPRQVSNQFSSQLSHQLSHQLSRQGSRRLFMPNIFFQSDGIP